MLGFDESAYDGFITWRGFTGLRRDPGWGSDFASCFKLLLFKVGTAASFRRIIVQCQRGRGSLGYGQRRELRGFRRVLNLTDAQVSGPTTFYVYETEDF